MALVWILAKNGTSIHAYLQICILTYLYTCTLVYLNTCILAYMHTTHILAYLYSCILAYFHICMCSLMQQCIYAYLHTCIMAYHHTGIMAYWHTYKLLYLHICVYLLALKFDKWYLQVQYFWWIYFLMNYWDSWRAYDLKISTTKNWQRDLERDKILWVSNLAHELLARNYAVGAKCLRRQH